MTDLVTRLILDNDGFNRNLHLSREEIQQFQRAGSSVTSMLSKFAGAAGLVVGGIETLSTAINSNSATQNTWNDILGTTKESVDSFFTSLTSGDWSIWENGIGNAITLSKKYTQALRELKGNLQIGDVRLSQEEKELNRLENIASDESNSKAKREKAFADFKRQGKETVDYINGLSKSTNDNLITMLEGKGIKADKSVRDMIFKYLDTSTAGGQELKRYELLKERAASLKAQSNGIATSPMEIEAKGKAMEKYKTTLQELADLQKKNPELDAAYKLKLNFNAEEIQELLDYTDKLIGLEDRLESAKKQVTDLSKDFDKYGHVKPKSSTKTHSTPTAPSKGKSFEQFSLGYYEQIYAAQKKVRDGQSKTNEEYEKANDNLKITQSIIDHIKKGDGIGEYFMLQHQLRTDPNLANLNKATSGQKDPVYIEFDKLNKAEQEWTEKLEQFYLKYNLKGENGLPSIEKFDKYFNEYFKGNKSSVTEVQVAFAKGSLNELRAERQKLIDELNNASTQEERVRIQAEINKNTKTENKYLGKAEVKTTNDYAVSLNAIATAMSNISSMTNNSATAWLTWSSNLMSSIATAIPAIQALTVAKTAEAEANAVASATQTPVVGWLLAGAAVASVAAALASMPKFAEGGIFEGNSTFGDMNLARVNAGEMILNNRQQRNLFNLLNNGGVSSSPSRQVEFKIQGKQLVGVLNNYNKQMRKL